MADPANEISSGDLQARERVARRAAARRQRQHRRRQAGAVGLVLLLGVVILVLALGGSGGHSTAESTASRPSPIKKQPVLPGGPLAPAAFGGLASLWAPQNVVGATAGTAASYQAASTRPGLPGYLMIA